MKIVDRVTFLSLPEGTLFSKYEPCVFEPLEIKGESLTNDFFAQQIADSVNANDSGEFSDILHRAELFGESYNISLYCEYRDGMFDQEQLFAVWEPKDVSALISRLQSALANTTGEL